MDKQDGFEELAAVTKRVVKELESKMKIRRNRRFNMPATEETKRLTRRMLGERDD